MVVATPGVVGIYGTRARLEVNDSGTMVSGIGGPYFGRDANLTSVSKHRIRHLFANRARPAQPLVPSRAATRFGQTSPFLLSNCLK